VRTRHRLTWLALGCVLVVSTACGTGTPSGAGTAPQPSRLPPVSPGTLPATTAPTTATTAPAAGIPRFSHIVVVLEENHAYPDIIGNPAAAYLNALAHQGALFTDSEAVTHPSEPNYLALFSGSTQGVTNDSCPHTFGAADLGGQLLAAHDTFTGYSQDLPGTGFTGCASGDYARKHNPWVNFTNVPAQANRPFTDFPRAYAKLPTVSFVIPNLADDMHDGTIGEADSWLRTNLDGYVTWARDNDSLLVLTFDEDDTSHGNHIATIFVGAHVRPGSYPERIDHYTVLRTIEAAYGLAPLGNAASVAPITDVWS
jgi:acid phosphatase